MATLHLDPPLKKWHVCAKLIRDWLLMAAISPWMQRRHSLELNGAAYLRPYEDLDLGKRSYHK